MFTQRVADSGHAASGTGLSLDAGALLVFDGSVVSFRRRTGTKQEAVIAMLRAEGSATIEEIMAATKWAGHTTRGFLSGALKKKLGLDVTSEKVEGRGRVYTLT